MITNEELEVLHAHDSYSLTMLLSITEDEMQAWDRLGYLPDAEEEERVSILKSILGARGVFDMEEF